MAIKETRKALPIRVTGKVMVAGKTVQIGSKTVESEKGSRSRIILKLKKAAKTGLFQMKDLEKTDDFSQRLAY
ncbi:MAG: hypothetical protein Q8Q65_00285 [bacterium]|nr:hypothetical protein [bacterium]